MSTTGTVREWHLDRGWGVLDSPDTPGGCWAHHLVLEAEEDRPLAPGAVVTFEFARPGRDGFDFTATHIWPARPVRVFRAADLEPADPTPGMQRHRAFDLPLLWAGHVQTAPGAVSGWHHHERNESCLYVVRGTMRMEFEGLDGYLDAGPGDFLHVPAFTVHRESNPTDEPSLAVIARVGGGVPTVNVDPPPGR